MIIGIVVCCVWALFLITGAFVLLLLAFAFSISGIVFCNVLVMMDIVFGYVLVIWGIAFDVCL